MPSKIADAPVVAIETLQKTIVLEARLMRIRSKVLMNSR